MGYKIPQLSIKDGHPADERIPFKTEISGVCELEQLRLVAAGKLTLATNNRNEVACYVRC
jgi:hypothetical protein